MPHCYGNPARILSPVHLLHARPRSPPRVPTPHSRILGTAAVAAAAAVVVVIAAASAVAVALAVVVVRSWWSLFCLSRHCLVLRIVVVGLWLPAVEGRGAPRDSTGRFQYLGQETRGRALGSMEQWGCSGCMAVLTKCNSRD